MLIRHMKRQHNGMARPSGSGDRRRPRPRPGNGAASWRNVAQQVCVSYAVRAEAAEAVVAEIATAGGRAIAVAADWSRDDRLHVVRVRVSVSGKWPELCPATLW